MKALSALNQYLFKYKWKLLLGFLFIILSNLFQVYAPQVIRQAVDTISETVNLMQNGEIDKTEVGKNLAKTGLYLGFLYILLAILKGVFLFFTRQTIIVVSRLIEFDLKNNVYNHFQKLSLSFYKANNTGDLMNRINEDVSKVRMYLGPAVMYTANLIVLFILSIAFMLMVNVELTLYVLAPLPIMSVCVYFVSNLINKRSEDVQVQQSKLSTYAQEDFSGIRVIKAFNQGTERNNRFSMASDQYMEKNLDLVTVNALFHPIIILLIGLSTIITIYIGGQKVINGEDGLTIGNIAEFVIYINMLTWPFAAVGWVTSLTQRAAASQKRINDLLLVEPEIVSKPNPNQTIKGLIQFKDVSFTYPTSGIKALKNISFTVKPGEILAVIGRTGSGKSTLINLLNRQYDPTKGDIFIDKENLKNIDLEKLHEETGYVPQEVFLFSESIADNIAFGLDKNTSMSVIEQAATDAHIHHNIIEFPKGYNTLLGERGINLSGGQKQRISIARALVKNPSILIFDDCLSAVDAETEEIILSNLRRIMLEKTCVIVSHRISAVKNADQIIYLEDGVIVEKGSHHELIELKGGYYKLYLKQLKEAQNKEIA